MGGTVLGPGDEADLIDLAFHWNEAYDIAVLDGIWTARAICNPLTVLTADTADELRTMIRSDYAKVSSRAGAGRVRVTEYLSERMST